MFFSLMHSKPTSFLQRTSNGVILNRFSNDVNHVDNDLLHPMSLFVGSSSFFITLSITITKGISSVVALVPLILFIYLSYRARSRYMAANREATRLTKVSKSPVIGTSVSSIGGGPIIRTLGCSGFLQKKIDHFIHENSKNFIQQFGLNAWFAYQQQIYQNLIIVIPLSCMTLWSHYNTEKIDPDVAAFLQFIQQFAVQFFGMLMNFSQVELSLICLERIDQYEKLEGETGYLNIENDVRLFKDLKKSKLGLAKKNLEDSAKLLDSGQGAGSSGPLFKEGRIRVKNVSARYPTSQADVLKDIDLEIIPGQTVGIVGRTGAGKSSFSKLLWRAMDPREGSIEIDGIDISSIDAKELRAQLNIVLQKPSVFEGTLLSNISKQALKADSIALIREELIDLGFPQHKLIERDLSYEVKECGSNLSESEKQIICLVQALQRRKSKVVILDEATAYVDLSMEKRFQQRIEKAFKDSTVFIIAHKISNVMNADRILVFEGGRIVQDGSPQELVEDVDGPFYQIWRRR